MKKSKAEIKKKYRLKKAIKDIVINNYDTSYFLTLTFSNETLKNTTKEKRLLIIKNYLNNQTDKYILNCDYGSKKGREHYHALVIAKDKYINFTLFNEKYGHIYPRPINLNKNQSKESQINILLEHELKETSERIIYYSRSKRANHKAKDKTYYKTNQNTKAFNSFIKKEFKDIEEQQHKEQEQKKIREYLNRYLFNKWR